MMNYKIECMKLLNFTINEMTLIVINTINNAQMQ